MNFVAPAVTAVYASLIGLLAAGLTIQVIRNRVRSGVQTGDGGDASLACAIRAHANLGEQAPLALLLLALAEATGAAASVVQGLGALLLVARLASAWGLSHSLGPTMPRQAGAGMTIFMVIATSLLTLWQAIGAR
jgi:uncharacterized protein